MRGPPPRRSWRFTALDRRAPQAALHRVDFFGRPRAAENCFGRPSGRPRSFNAPVTDERRRLTLTLILCCLAQFMVVLDVSIVNVALPSISADLGFTPASLAWVVNAYTLAFAGFLLLGGRAADLLGRREVFAGGLALFALASLAGGLAQSELTLVAARAAQGLGGAVVAPATLSILTTSFPEGHERNRALGWWGAMGAIGGASGALLGGVLTETLSWRWILIINVPIGLLGALAALRVVRTGSPRRGRRRGDFDLAGRAQRDARARRRHLRDRGVRVRHGWGSARTLLTLAAGVALLARLPPGRGAARRAAARAAADLRLARAVGRERRRVLPRRLGLRDVVLPLALPPAGARLLADRGGPRVPADAADDRGLHAGGDAPDDAARAGSRAGRRGWR